MFRITIDRQQIEALSKKQIDGRIQKAATSALKSEGNYLRGVLGSEARSTAPPISPLTQALKKGKRSVWQVLAPMMRYWVDESPMELHVGLLEVGPRPIARRAAVFAKKHSRGYRLLVTRAAQKSLSEKLRRKYRVIEERNAWEMFGGLRSFIPVLGPHAVRKTDVVGAILDRQKLSSIQRVKRNFSIKLAGGRH